MLAPKPRLAVLAAIAIVATLAFIPSAQTQETSTGLQGEFLEADQGTLGGEIHFSGECNPTGNTTLSYTASGPATGPFPGTFAESGTLVLGPPGSGPIDQAGPTARAVVEFTAGFTIDSELGQVTGTKSKLEPDALSNGVCNNIDPTIRVFDALVERIRYEATIVTAAGTLSDSGIAGANFHAEGTPGAEQLRHFQEHFQVSDGVQGEDPIDEPDPLPAETTGKATGAGQVSDAASSSRVSFGLAAMSNDLASSSDSFDRQGRCVVEDRTRSTRVNCLNVTYYTQAGGQATFSGDAVVNGQPAPYTITVHDVEEPNRGLDTVEITAGGYSAAGNVSSGNIQVHQPG